MLVGKTFNLGGKTAHKNAESRGKDTFCSRVDCDDGGEIAKAIPFLLSKRCTRTFSYSSSS